MAKKTNTKSPTKSARATKITRKTPKHEQWSAWGIIWRLVICIAIPLGGGFIISLLTRNAQEIFGNLNQPPLAPPAWLFPVAWTILYVLMGLASFLIAFFGTRRPDDRKCLLILYGIQLAFNFLWSIIFFNFKLYTVAFALLVVMWLLILAITFKSPKISGWITACFVPYLLWVTFAGYLNVMIAILN